MPHCGIQKDIVLRRFNGATGRDAALGHILVKALCSGSSGRAARHGLLAKHGVLQVKLDDGATARAAALRHISSIHIIVKALCSDVEQQKCCPQVGDGATAKDAALHHIIMAMITLSAFGEGIVLRR
jgi:hypothetical protein